MGLWFRCLGFRAYLGIQNPAVLAVIPCSNGLFAYYIVCSVWAAHGSKKSSWDPRQPGSFGSEFSAPPHYPLLYPARVWSGGGCWSNVGASIIRIGFGGPLYYNYN